MGGLPICPCCNRPCMPTGARYLGGESWSNGTAYVPRNIKKPYAIKYAGMLVHEPCMRQLEKRYIMDLPLEELPRRINDVWHHWRIPEIIRERLRTGS